jgi:hypothetical protein
MGLDGARHLSTTQTWVIEMTRILIALGLVAAIWCLPDASVWAQPIVAQATSMKTWAVALIKIFAVIVIIGAFIMVCTGRWYATAGMLIGIIGAAKAEEIAAYFNIG